MTEDNLASITEPLLGYLFPRLVRMYSTLFLGFLT